MVCQNLSLNLLHSLPVHRESRNGIEQIRVNVVTNISAACLAVVFIVVIVVKFYCDVAKVFYVSQRLALYRESGISNAACLNIFA